jgi:hypothetical protein
LCIISIEGDRLSRWRSECKTGNVLVTFDELPTVLTRLLCKSSNAYLYNICCSRRHVDRCDPLVALLASDVDVLWRRAARSLTTDYSEVECAVSDGGKW